MSDKKLLLITPDFPPNEGGVARYLRALAEHLHDRIEVLADPHPNWNQYDPTAGYPIYRAPLLSRFMWPRWVKMVRYLWSYRSRYTYVLTSHVLPVGTAAWVAKKLTGIPYAVFVHGMDLRLAARKATLTKKVLKGASLVVANSQALARELARDFDIHEVLVVHPCVSPLTDTLASDAHPFRLLTVSRLVARKGHSHVLNALAHLRGTGELSAFEYHIAGEGPMEATLKSMAQTLDLQDHVVFHGPVSDQKRDELYGQSDVFVMPVSTDPIDKEGFGLVYIEAAQAGVPSIAMNIEGVDEAVLDGQTGLLLQSQNEQELATAILQLYRNAEFRNQLCVNAQEYAKTFLCEAQMSKLDPYL